MFSALDVGPFRSAGASRYVEGPESINISSLQDENPVSEMFGPITRSSTFVLERVTQTRKPPHNCAIGTPPNGRATGPS